VINVAASLPHFWMSLSTLMMRFTRKRGSCVVGSLVAEVFLAFPGGGVLLMVGEAQRSGGGRSPHRQETFPLHMESMTSQIRLCDRPLTTSNNLYTVNEIDWKYLNILDSATALCHPISKEKGI